MNKEEELKCLITTLDKCVKEMNAIIGSMATLIDTKVEISDNTTEKPIRLEVIRGILADKSQQGYTIAIKKILNSFGATKLSELEPSVYQSVLEKVEELGDGN